jgi:hypothetical protein
MPAAGVAQATSTARGRGGDGNCPAAESLVPHQTWHKHTLAPGVVMRNATATDSRGTVNMHVLRVNVASKNISLHPLMHSIAERSPLSTLAKGHTRLVAATNTGYFDFRTGAPTQPLIVGKVPLVISTKHQAVVGLGTNGVMESGTVWWAAVITAGSRIHDLASKNDINPPDGISLYTKGWGGAPVPASWNGVARSVVDGVVGSAGHDQRGGLAVPSSGYLLVAHGQSASNWLSSLSTGTKVSVASSVVTSAPKPFVQAYGVGVEVVQTPGVIRTGLSCNSINTKQPARTEIGWANGGRTLIIAIVADNPNTSMHGLDEDQMSELMVQLGASQAWAFDGSGSTELLAKLAHSSGLALENYPADGQERPMPVGLGIASKPVKAKKAKKAKKKH